MRLTLRLLGQLALLFSCAVVASAQAPMQIKVRMQAPTDKAVDFSLAELQRSYEEMDGEAPV